MGQDQERGRIDRNERVERFTPDQTRDRDGQGLQGQQRDELVQSAASSTGRSNQPGGETGTTSPTPISSFSQPAAVAGSTPATSDYGTVESQSRTTTPPTFSTPPTPTAPTVEFVDTMEEGEGEGSWARWALLGAGVALPLAALALPATRQTILRSVRTGTQQITEQVEEVRAARQAEQERERLERHRQLMQAIAEVERELVQRRKRRGGLLRTVRPFALGSLLGAGLGLLYAPQAGKETQQQLRQRANLVTTEVTEGAIEVGQSAQQVVSQVKEQAQQTAGQVQQAVGQAVEQAQGTTAQVKEQVQQTAGQVKEQAQQTSNQAAQRAQASVSPAGGSSAPQRPATAPAPAQAAAPSSPPSPFLAQIREHMPVMAANGESIGTVDALEGGNTIKLTKDAQGHHHWIPLAWVARVDKQVRLNRPAQQVRREWATRPSERG